MKTNKKGFSLIELLVVITVIFIIVLGARTLSFKNISDAQKLDRTIARLVGNIETIRNNALLGKGMGVGLDVPEKYSIYFSNNGGQKISFAYSNGGAIMSHLSIDDIDFSILPEKIEKIQYISLSGAAIEDINPGTGTLIFCGGYMKLQDLSVASEDCKTSSYIHKAIEITISRRDFKKVLRINTVNGLVTVD